MNTRMLATGISAAVLAQFVGGCGDPSGPGSEFASFVVFSALREEQVSLYRINLNGTNLRRLIPTEGFQGAVDASGTKMVYAAGQSNQEIYYRDLRSGISTLIASNIANDFRPALDKTGTRIVFVSERDGGDRELWTIRSDATGLARLTVRPGEDTQPSISPNGQRVVFTFRGSGTGQISIINMDGTGITNLSNNAFDEITPSFSPDGSRIVFSSNRLGGGYDLFTMNTDGTNVTRLFALSGNEFNPSFTPDGTRVVFEATGTGLLQIHIANLDGTGLGNISNSSSNDSRTANIIPGG